MESINKDKVFSEILKSYLEESERKGSLYIRALLEMLLDTLIRRKGTSI